jgi:hypothetical protein
LSGNSDIPVFDFSYNTQSNYNSEFPQSQTTQSSTAALELHIASEPLASLHEEPSTSNDPQLILPGFTSPLEIAEHLFEYKTSIAEVESPSTNQFTSEPSRSPPPLSSVQNGNLACTWPSCKKTFSSTSSYK